MLKIAFAIPLFVRSGDIAIVRLSHTLGTSQALAMRMALFR